MNRGWLLATFILLWIAGCMVQLEPPRPPGALRIGTLRVDGTGVFLNQTRARDGMQVYDGDTLTTEANSSATVEFLQGGLVQLDEQTDPIFKLLRESLCILVNIVKGQVFVNSGNMCIEIQTQNLAGALNSSINMHVTSEQSVLTVLQGAIRVTEPRELSVRALEQVVISQSEVKGPYVLSREGLDKVVAWRWRFESLLLHPPGSFRPAPLPPSPRFRYLPGNPTTPPPIPPPYPYPSETR